MILGVCNKMEVEIFLVYFSVPSCQTLSKDCEMSRNAQVQNTFSQEQKKPQPRSCKLDEMLNNLHENQSGSRVK